MGTSSSSSGPHGKVAFDPPWLDIISIETTPDDSKPEKGSEDSKPIESSETTKPAEIAPQGRFRTAKTSLGRYVGGGDRTYLKKALGSYSRKGMGGASRVATRMRVPATVGANLFSFFQQIRDNSDPKTTNWLDQLISKSSSLEDVINEITNKLIPNGGSLDEESCKNSLNNALTDILSENPDIDMLKMDDTSIWLQWVSEKWTSRNHLGENDVQGGNHCDSCPSSIHC